MIASRRTIRADAQLALRIAYARQQAGFTQRALAARLGVSHGAVQHYECGHSRVPLMLLARIAEVTGKETRWFEEERPE